MYLINTVIEDNRTKKEIKYIIDKLLTITHLTSIYDSVKRFEMVHKIKMIYVLNNCNINLETYISMLDLNENENININILIHKLDRCILNILYPFWQEHKQDTRRIKRINFYSEKENLLNEIYKNMLYNMIKYDKNKHANITKIELFKLYYNFYLYIYFNDYDLKTNDLSDLYDMIKKLEHQTSIKMYISLVTSYLNNNIYIYLYQLNNDNKTIENLYK